MCIGNDNHFPLGDPSIHLTIELQEAIHFIPAQIPVIKIELVMNFRTNVSSNDTIIAKIRKKTL